MTTMHEEWTDKLSDYLDGELPDDERYAVESHLAGCPHCAGVLADLRRIVERAQALDPRPPRADLWAGVAARIESRPSPAVTPFRARAARRVSFTIPQAIAASVVIALVSGALAVKVLAPATGPTSFDSTFVAAPPPPPEPAMAPAEASAANGSFADAQYDAAVADLESALNKQRGRLDPATIAAVEHNLQIIDQAIAQARQALAADPANSYLSTHLVETRRRKLDLLRRAAALTESSD
jgi:hypothetical protein